MAWESIGLDRLSLCYTLRGDTKKAVDCCVQSRHIASNTTYTTIEALSRFFYGRALHRDGQHDVAMIQLSSAKPCSPAIALCKEPSEEHRQYLQDLVDLGVDMALTDENGYAALDYAVFNNEHDAETLVLTGLRKGFGESRREEIEQLRTNSYLRKGYRELFQERLRPVLLKSNLGDNLQTLRREYALSLSEDEGKRQLFDAFNFVRYTDFHACGRLPSWGDSSLQTFKDHESEVDFVIFFSYRWINKAKPAKSPDGENNTQLWRMVEATEEFLRLHPTISKDKLGVWVDYSCVCQDDPMPGVRALPMILMQCNAVISLYDDDDDDYGRAWCSVEVLMIQAIKRSYNLHLWYEQRPKRAEEGWVLEDGPMNLEISMAEKTLTKEEDRSKVLFLERQTSLLIIVPSATKSKSPSDLVKGPEVWAIWQKNKQTNKVSTSAWDIKDKKLVLRDYKCGDELSVSELGLQLKFEADGLGEGSLFVGKISYNLRLKPQNSGGISYRQNYSSIRVSVKYIVLVGSHLAKHGPPPPPKSNQAIDCYKNGFDDDFFRLASYLEGKKKADDKRKNKKGVDEKKKMIAQELPQTPELQSRCPEVQVLVPQAVSWPLDQWTGWLML
ncbi:hypothetical protein FZEAL_9663 [Fusarium zealandicum]|uniref:Ankyrin repeat protein n=1 Tax=Fusarium zealandicum TaxID=1053134 RepID=A0A8H4U9E8_9HYPO|nr:hypothetical protein FZEAL_9663 [Fusarium zealandicum]